MNDFESDHLDLTNSDFEILKILASYKTSGIICLYSFLGEIGEVEGVANGYLRTLQLENKGFLALNVDTKDIRILYPVITTKGRTLLESEF